MAQHAQCQIALTAVRIDQRASLVARHRIDREVAAQQVIRERHRRICMQHEPLVSPPLFALGAGKRILFVGLRMQKYGKVTSDRPKAERDHLGRAAAFDYIVMVADRQTQQLVTNGAADAVDFHRR